MILTISFLLLHIILHLKSIDFRSVSKLESFIMENGLLDRVEDNANVHIWSEQTQLVKENSLAMGYVSELSDYICITQDNQHG